MKLRMPAMTLALVSAVGLFAFACSSSSSPATGGTDAGKQNPKVDAGHPSSGTGTGTGSGVTPPKKDSGIDASSGSGSSTGSGTGTGGTDSGTKDAGTPDTGVDAAVDAPIVNPYECTIPATPPSMGSCITTVAYNDAGTGLQCNPVTNAGCPGSLDCDVNLDMSGKVIGFLCFDGPTAPVCGSCDLTATTGPYCNPGTTCFSLNKAETVSVCAQYCCTDADCGAGTCSITAGGFGAVANNSLGICVAPGFSPDAGVTPH